MKVAAEAPLSRLEDMPLWKEANDLAEYLYGKLTDFPEEERWYTRAKLHSAIADFVLWISLALGNSSPTGREFDWSQARKYAAAIKTVYRFAARQKCIELDPEIMVRLDKMQQQVDNETNKAFVQSDAYREAEAKRDLQPWLEKYAIWKKLNGEKT